MAVIKARNGKEFELFTELGDGGGGKGGQGGGKKKA